MDGSAGGPPYVPPADGMPQPLAGSPSGVAAAPGVAAPQYGLPAGGMADEPPVRSFPDRIVHPGRATDAQYAPPPVGAGEERRFSPYAPYDPRGLKEADYQYDFRPAAPANFPPPPPESGQLPEEAVPQKDVRDKKHFSFLWLLLGLLLLAGCLALAVLAGLACHILGWCSRIDHASTDQSSYGYQNFAYPVPTQWILAAFSVSAFGLFVAAMYAVHVIRKDVGSMRMVQIATFIRRGTLAFLVLEYLPLTLLVAVVTILLGFLAGWRSAVCYVIGAVLAALTGFLGLAVATRGNVRTAAAAERGLSPALNVAFRSGAAVGLLVVSIALGGLCLVYLLFADVRALAAFAAAASTVALFARVGGGVFTKAADVGAELVSRVEPSIPEDDPRNPATVTNGVGGHVGDVAGMGADLFESYVLALVAAAILGATQPYFYNNRTALCVYNHQYLDYLCGSYSDPPTKSSFANLVCSKPKVLNSYPALSGGQSQPLFVALPFGVALIGVAATVLCTLYVVAVGRRHVHTGEHGRVARALLWSLRANSLLAALLVLLGTLGLTLGLFGRTSAFQGSDAAGSSLRSTVTYYMDSGAGQCQPRTGFSFSGVALPRGAFINDAYRPLAYYGYSYPAVTQVWWRLFLSVVLGLILGLLLAQLTEYFTAARHKPAKGIAKAGEYGAGAVVIQGIGVGMLSVLLPVLLLVAVILGSFALFGYYGVALAAVGLVSTLGLTMAVDALAPVADDAGSLATMGSMAPAARHTADSLGALGSSTAAIARGVAAGAAVMSAFALLSALVQYSSLAPSAARLVSSSGGGQPRSFVYDADIISVLDIYVVIAVLVGIMLPYLFGALTMLAVSRAAQALVAEVRRQFRDIAGLRDGRAGARAQHQRCVRVSALFALAEIVLPALVALFAPMIIGFGFGQRALVALLLGAIASGYALSVMMTNAGGAWAGARRLVQSGHFGAANAVGSDWQHANAAGETVADPCKDTTGPSLHTLIKLMTALSFVFFPLMQLELTNGYIGLILLGAVAIFSAFFLLLYSLFTRSVRRKARAPVDDADGDGSELLVAPDARSPYISQGPGGDISRLPRNSALYNAYVDG